MLTRWIPVLLLLAAAGTAFAADGGPQAPCAADLKKLCPEVKAGGGRIIKCLKENEEKLSEGCRSTIQKMRNFKDPCQDDLKKHCKGVEPGKGGVLKCLHEHESQLSAPCKGALDRLKAQKAMHGGERASALED